MRTFVAGLVVLGAFLLVNIVGAVAFLAAGKLALHFDRSAATTIGRATWIVTGVMAAGGIGSCLGNPRRGVLD